jgi:hypothetical protein
MNSKNVIVQMPLRLYGEQQSWVQRVFEVIERWTPIPGTQFIDPAFASPLIIASVSYDSRRRVEILTAMNGTRDPTSTLDEWLSHNEGWDACEPACEFSIFVPMENSPQDEDEDNNYYKPGMN